MTKIKKYKISRRLGPIYEKTQTQKFAARAAAYKFREGKHSKSRTDYGLQMIKKQKVKYMYGLRERQFANYVRKAIASSTIKPELVMVQSLEGRLDNFIYRAGLAPTRMAARQTVTHGHIIVNGKKVSIPSYTVKVGDKVRVREGSLKSKQFAGIGEKLKEFHAPQWMRIDTLNKEIEMVTVPDGEESSRLDIGAILEFYKR